MPFGYWLCLWCPCSLPMGSPTSGFGPSLSTGSLLHSLCSFYMNSHDWLSYDFTNSHGLESCSVLLPLLKAYENHWIYPSSSHFSAWMNTGWCSVSHLPCRSTWAFRISWIWLLWIFPPVPFVAHHYPSLSHYTMLLFQGESHFSVPYSPGVLTVIWCTVSYKNNHILTSRLSYFYCALLLH